MPSHADPYVADRVLFIHGDAAGYVSDEKADVAACVGATWIARGVVVTIELLARSLRTGGIILIGEPYWRQEVPGYAESGENPIQPDNSLNPTPLRGAA